MSIGIGIRILAAPLILALSLTSEAEVLRVPQDYVTIQVALSAVADADTILVSMGTYAEELSAPPLRFWLIGDAEVDTGDFPRPIIDPSTLDSAQWRHCLLIPENAELTIENMKFVNGANMYPRPDPFDTGGIIINTEQPTTFRYCAFDSVYRAIVHDTPADVPINFIVEDCIFTNVPRVQIRAIDGQAIVRRCLFHALHCVSAVIIAGDSSLVEHCVFTGDSVNTFISLHGAELSIRECVFGPADSCGAALGMGTEGAAVIEGNVVQSVQLSGGVGGTTLFSGDVPVYWKRNYFFQNYTYDNGSTGIFLGHQTAPANSFSAVLDSNLFQDCTQTSNSDNGKALTIETRVSLTANRFIGLLPDSFASIAVLSEHDLSRMRYNQFGAQDFAANCLSGTMDAIYNYWGHPSGPFHPNTNPNGQGAQVSDSVRYDPWSPDTNFLSIDERLPTLADRFTLISYPNPFNSSVTLKLIPSAVAIVRVELFDLLGRRVLELWSGPIAYEKTISFDGSQLSSGIYFVRVWQPIGNRPLALTKLMLLK